VVDNGSTDDTPQVLAGWDDHRLRVIRNSESLGSVGGRNTGLQAAWGEWVGILDDDDLWSPDKLAAQLDAATRSGRHWAYAGCVHIDGADRILGGRPPPSPAKVMAELPVRFVLPGGMSNVIWRRDMLDGDGLLDPALPFPADWDVGLRLSRKGPPAMVPRPLIAYRQHGSNLSRDASRFREQLVRFEKKRADLTEGRGIDWGEQYRFVASEELRAGDRLAALRAYARAVTAGDLASLPRAAGVILPARLQAWARRTLLSDPAWIRDVERWLYAGDDVTSGPGTVAPFEAWSAPGCGEKQSGATAGSTHLVRQRDGEAT
jgi:glycosyltransferase involved in cell wall biosynthesis